MDHRNQHYVPSSYLEAWCDPDAPPHYEPYVWRIPKNGGEGQAKAPKNIFAESDFYTSHLPDGQRDLSLEHGLATLESKFCEIRDARIANREPLNTEDKVSLCAFVAAMHFRTRAQRNALQKQWGHAHRVVEDVRQALNAMTPAQRREYRPPRSLSKTTGPSLTIDEIKILASEPIQHMLLPAIANDLPVLARMNLCIFTTEDEVGFITSDHPCVWYDPNRRRIPTSLRARTIEVTMPISPNSLAFLCWEDVPEYKSLTLPGVDGANALRQIACKEYFVVRRNATKSVWFT
jgi:uncharacterized protein DUF4238